jgi:hypothetical protein
VRSLVKLIEKVEPGGAAGLAGDHEPLKAWLLTRMRNSISGRQPVPDTSGCARISAALCWAGRPAGTPTR